MAMLLSSAPLLAQSPPDQPMPPPAPEGDETAPPPTLPPSPTPPPQVVERAPRRMYAGHHRAAGTSGEDVVRAVEGNWGIGWRFGGLATLAATGRIQTAGNLQISQVLVKYVLSEQWMIPFWAGTGVLVTAPDGGDSSADWGLDFGGGVEYHFRIWRRISPYIGGALGMIVTDPAGPRNWSLTMGLGPQLGIEYYIADRLSMQALYQVLLAFTFTDPAFGFSFATQSGGALNLTAYF